MAPTLIGLHAVKQGGKDTTAGFIQQWGAEHNMSYRKRGIADEMKLALARLFFGTQPWVTMEWAVNWADTFKEHRNAFVEVPFEIATQPKDWPGAPIFGTRSTHVRDLMRFMGTEVGRRMWGDDFWVDKLLPFGPSLSVDHKQIAWRSSFFVGGGDSFMGFEPHTADLCVISDVRFENEIRRIHDLGGITIKILRKTAEDVVIAEAQAQGKEVHISDLLLPNAMFDYVIDNSDDVMENSRKRTYSLLEHHALLS